jgi:head-tail adaptor
LKISSHFFNSTVVIQNKANITKTSTSGIDDYGSYTYTWSTATPYIASLPCCIQWLSGSERTYIDKETYIRDGIVYCDYSTAASAIEPKNYRVLYGSKYYDIVDVENPDQLNQHIAISIKREE